MRYLPGDRLRNVALVSQSKAGKTQLAEAMLYVAGATNRFGKVDDGNAVTDFDPDEIARKMSIQTAVATLTWRDHRINLLDTPGYLDFAGEVHGALRAADAAVFVCDAASGLEAGTELAWRLTERYRLPRLIFINKLDRENADFFSLLEQLPGRLGSPVVPLQFPIGREAQLAGVVDLLNETAVFFDGASPRPAPIPADLAPQAADMRLALIEAIAETDEALLEQYLDDAPLSVESLRVGLAAAVAGGKLIPVLAGAGLTGVGVSTLLDAVVDYLPPAPGASDAAQPFSAFVFKTFADPYVGRLSIFKVCGGSITADSTVYNPTRGVTEKIGQLMMLCGKQQIPVGSAQAGDIVAAAKLQATQTGDTLCDRTASVQFDPIELPTPVFPVAVEPKKRGDEEKLSQGLARLAEEDPVIRLQRDAETGQTVLYGMGELHLDVITSRLARKFGVEVKLSTPKVPYRETISRAATAEYKHKKQSGGRGQYGHVFLRLEPLGRGEGIIFDEEIFGGAVPRQYIPAVEKGVREAAAEGVLAGYPVTDVKVVLYDGSHHSVDSSELAFKLAAAQAFKKGCREAAPVLLEPIVNLEILVPEAYLGDVLGDLNKRRGRVLSMSGVDDMQLVRAQVPLAETFQYAIDLRSMTQGRGSFTLNHSHYEEAPEQVARHVIEGSVRA